MIETTINEVDGVRFYTNIRILEPDDKRYGVSIHYIPERGREPELITYIKLMGLREVGYTPILSGGAYIYAEYPIAYWRFKAAEVAFKCYWRVVRWLYDNARFFKQIPEAECFSWRYFTPYVWYRKLRS